MGSEFLPYGFPLVCSMDDAILPGSQRIKYQIDAEVLLKHEEAMELHVHQISAFLGPLRFQCYCCSFHGSIRWKALQQ